MNFAVISTTLAVSFNDKHQSFKPAFEFVGFLFCGIAFSEKKFSQRMWFYNFLERRRRVFFLFWVVLARNVDLLKKKFPFYKVLRKIAVCLFNMESQKLEKSSTKAPNKLKHALIKPLNVSWYRFGYSKLLRLNSRNPSSHLEKCLFCQKIRKANYAKKKRKKEKKSKLQTEISRKHSDTVWTNFIFPHKAQLHIWFLSILRSSIKKM